MILLAYNLATFILYVLLFPFLGILAIRGDIKWKHRLGYGHNPGNAKIDIWMHAASMGEVMVLKILTDQILRINPETTFYITVMTNTGYKKAVSLFGKDSVGYLPLDASLSVNKFLNNVTPNKAVIVETEIWFTLIRLTHKKSIPIFLANGRLTDRSLGSYLKIKGSMKKLFACYENIMVQSESYRNRFVKLGAESSKIKVIGNLKFDAHPTIVNEEDKIKINKVLPFCADGKILVCGSIRNDEFETITEIVKAVKKKNEDIGIIIVPRYLDKINELSEMLTQNELSSVLLTYIENQQSKNIESDILIVDKMGVLNDIYSISDIAVVGGTFDNMGGHNVLEPVWAGIPVLFGPSYEGVLESAEYVFENGYGEAVADSREMIDKLNRFFNNELTYKTKDLNSIETPRAKMTVDFILKKAAVLCKLSGNV